MDSIHILKILTVNLLRALLFGISFEGYSLQTLIPYQRHFLFPKSGFKKKSESCYAASQNSFIFN